MGLIDEVQKMRNDATAKGKAPVADTYQGVSKDRIRAVLRLLEREKDDTVDVVFALLDDEHRSWFSKARDGTKFCDGATTAHVGCHVGILQRGRNKLDREGRDYWIKPLRDIGAIEAVYLDPATRTFLPGHPKAKSGNSAYRLSADFVGLLQSADENLDANLRAWIDEESLRDRLAFQAEQAEAARKLVVNDHVDLIRACRDHYAPRFLPGFEVLYVDDADGDRITDADRVALARAGLALELGDAMPDVLLWNPTTDALWIIEAVTSDGEVDQHKVSQLRAFAERHEKASIGFTTAYPSWKVAAQRQGTHKNIPAGTYVWIRDDAAKHWKAESFPV